MPAELGLPSFADLSRIASPSLTLPAFHPPPAALARLEARPMGREKGPAAVPVERKPTASSAAPPPWLLAVCLAVVGGVGLRFVALPDFVLPIAVGLAVATAVVLAIRLAGTAPETPSKPTLTVQPLLRPVKRVENTDSRANGSGRLPTLTRKSPSGSYRRPTRK